MDIKPILRDIQAFSSSGNKVNHQLIHKPTNLFIISRIVVAPIKYIEINNLLPQVNENDMDALGFNGNLPFAILRELKLKIIFQIYM